MNSLPVILRICHDYWSAASRQCRTSFFVFAAGLFIVATISLPFTLWQLAVNALVALTFAALFSYGLSALACVGWILMHARDGGLPLHEYVGTSAYRDALAAYMRDSAIKWW